MRNWKRRDFLRHSAMASMVAPIAAYWGDLPEARAVLGRRNMVLVFFSNGDVNGEAVAKVVGPSWQFGRAYTAYEKFRDDMIVFSKYGYHEIGWGHTASGCSVFSGSTIAHPTDCAGEGQTGSRVYAKQFAGMRTCAVGEEEHAPIGPTIDQIVAWDYLKRGVITDPLRKSVNATLPSSDIAQIFFQTPPDYTFEKTYPVTTKMKEVGLQTYPHKAFAQLFGGVASMASGASASKLWALGKSVLDLPARELQSIKGLVPSDAHVLLDRHLSGLRDVEVSLTQQTPVDAKLPAISSTLDPSDFNNHEQLFKLWVKVIDSAFRFDRTRIATIQFGGSGARYLVPSLGLSYVSGSDGINGTDHHSYTHNGPDGVWRFLKWYSDQIAILLDALKGESTGQPNILRDSVVMVGTESGSHIHQSYDVPMLLFGQAGGYLKTGQIVDHGNDPHKHTGTLLTLCHAMGLEGRMTRLGNPMFQGAPIDALKA